MRFMIEQLEDYGYQWIRSSHRSIPEQLVGLGIYLIMSFGFYLLHGWFIAFSTGSLWVAKSIPFLPEGNGLASPLMTLYFIFLSLSMWVLWRRTSLKRLKLELSLFLSLLSLMALWSFSFFVLQESLLGLVSVLLASCTIVLTAILFWKKERLASLLLSIPFFWVFYLSSLTMYVCTKAAS